MNFTPVCLVSDLVNEASPRRRRFGRSTNKRGTVMGIKINDVKQICDANVTRMITIHDDILVHSDKVIQNNSIRSKKKNIGG